MITDTQYREMIARTERNNLRNPTPADAVERESNLHDDIIDLCRSRGWVYIHARMDKKSTLPVGTPDFAIFLDQGRCVCLECKKKNGKATIEQLATIAMLKKLGHTAGIVQSMSEVYLTIKELDEKP